MKILIGNDGYSAHYYIRLGLGRAFTACGHEVIMWQYNQKPVHDAFDELEPDIFISQTFNLTPTIVRAIMERPHLRVICKSGDWGQTKKEINQNEYSVLFATNEEIDTVLKLKEQTGQPDYVYIHYHPDYIQRTHGEWIKHGVTAYSQLSASDIFAYTGGRRTAEFDCDICFIGGYWDYKARMLDKYIIPLCKDYRVKIFGNSNWPVPQYCGFLPDDYVKHALASATICPNIGEPHSRKFGFDVIERPFKLASNKCFIISDYVAGLRKLYPEDEIILAEDPKMFFDILEYYIKNPDNRQPYIEKAFRRTINEHTYFDRVREIFTRLGYLQEANKVDFAKQNVLQKLGIIL